MYQFQIMLSNGGALYTAGFDDVETLRGVIIQEKPINVLKPGINPTAIAPNLPEGECVINPEHVVAIYDRSEEAR